MSTTTRARIATRLDRLVHRLDMATRPLDARLFAMLEHVAARIRTMRRGADAMNPDTHLRDLDPETLAGIACDGCGRFELDEYACPLALKNNEPTCLDCCGCPEHVDDPDRDAYGAPYGGRDDLEPGPVQTVGRVHVSRDLLEPSSTVDNVDPHGIPRPTRADLARAFLVRVADVLDVDDVDADALATLVDALDALDTLEDPRSWDVSTLLENRRAAIAAGAYGTTLDAGPRRVEWHPIATRSRIVDGLDRLETDPEPEPDRLEPCEHGHYLCAVEDGGTCSNAEPWPDLEPAGDTTRADLEHAAQAATRRALEAPAPILAAFLEDGTYSVGQLAAVLDVRGWTAADLDRLEACADRDRLAIALDLDARRLEERTR